ncbi:MAG: ATP-binding protein [Elusimicrobia bacterium]|nr:ATP-binding protein [Elusimicrobiota bacterium]
MSGLSDDGAGSAARALCAELKAADGASETRALAALARVFPARAARSGVLDGGLGVLTAGFFRRLLEGELAGGAEAGLILFHSDRLAEIRREKGEALAAQVLGRMAEVLRPRQTAAEWLGRVDGDSLALLLPQAGLLATQERAQSLHELLHRNSRLPVSTGASHTRDLSGGPADLLRLAARAAQACRDAGGREARALTSRGPVPAPVPAADSSAAGAPSLTARYQRLVLLNRMSLELFADKPFAEALADACGTVLALTGGKSAAVYFCDDIGQPSLAARRGEGPWTAAESRSEEAALAARALAERRLLTPPGGRLGWAAAPLLYPLQGDRGGLGALVVGLPEPRPGDPELEQTLLEISRLLRNARLMQRHLEDQKVLAAVTEQSADAIYITDGEERIVSWNTAAETLFGRSRADMLGRPLALLVPPERLAEHAESDAQALREGCPKNFETVRLRRDGSLVAVEATFFPLRDEKGRLFGMVRVCRDITRRKEIERMKSEFVSLVSHELRTPLTAIQGFAETIFDFWDELQPEQRRHYLGIILSESQRLGRLVTNFLDISRLEAGGVLLRPALVDLPGLARRAAVLFKEHPSQASFLVDFAPGSERAWADEEQLYRVLVNLLGNAVKYSPSGGQVAVRGRAAGPAVEVAVADQGPGIPPEAQEKLFQKFYRVGDPISRKTPGTGLGLAICKNIVEGHGGRIWVESEPSRGAVFKFALPREAPRPACES